MGEAVWGGCQPQPWRNDNVSSPQVTMNQKSEPSSVGITVEGCYCMLMNIISVCSNTLYLYMSNMDAGQKAVWGGCQPQPLRKNDIIFDSTSYHVPQNLSWVGWVYNCVRLLQYAHGQHINVLKHCVYVLYGYRMQFGVAVSLNHDVMAMMFQVYNWARTPKSWQLPIVSMLWYQ